MTSCWVENASLFRDYPQYLKAQIIPGNNHSLVISPIDKDLSRDPYFQGYKVVECIQFNGVIYVLLQLRSDQDYESLFTHMKVIAMTVQDHPGHSPVPTQQYVITVILPSERTESISVLLPVSN